MKLQYYCSSCKRTNDFRPKAATRGDLQMQIGDEAQVNCKNCGNREKKHLNNIHAVVNNNIILAGVALGIMATISLWNYYGAVAAATFLVPILFWVQENNAVTGFNKYLIKRK